MRLIERAPAKVNLTLHILGRYPNGYHELESLVAFAGCGDLLSLEPDPALSLAVEGPGADAAGPISDNLVVRAARHLMQIAPALRVGRFRLTKRLPAAAGLGGGSSDAAAALRLLARANDLGASDERLFAAARETGADVPVCLDPRARMMGGIGDTLGPKLNLPPMFCVLVNPRTAVETRAVFQALGLSPGQRARPRAPVDFAGLSSVELLTTRLRDETNDMEQAASAMTPAIPEVLQALAQTERCRLARMSGSGATCFALYDSGREASRAATRLRADHASWWVKATVLR